MTGVITAVRAGQVCALLTFWAGVFIADSAGMVTADNTVAFMAN